MKKSNTLTTLWLPSSMLATVAVLVIIMVTRL